MYSQHDTEAGFLALGLTADEEEEDEEEEKERFPGCVSLRTPGRTGPTLMISSASIDRAVPRRARPQLAAFA